MLAICKSLRFPALAIASILAATTATSFGGDSSSDSTCKENYKTPEHPGLAVKDAAPDVTLKTVDGTDVTLSDLWKDKPVVLTFYRGGWCPYCTKALAGWEKRMPELATAGATFVAITPEKPEYITKTVEKEKLGFVVLSDADGAAQRAYNLQFTLDEDTVKKYKGYGIDLSTHNADGTWTLPAPATFVIDTEGTVTWVYADWDYKERADPKDVIAAVSALHAASN